MSFLEELALALVLVVVSRGDRRFVYVECFVCSAYRVYSGDE